jgi:RNA polymerase sigma factor (sigma-70 family)
LTASLKGDQRSQELIYKQYYGFAMSVSLKYTKSRDEAIEIVNDGFVKVFTRGEKYNIEIPFKVWFRRILINTALDAYRKNKKHYFHEDISEELDVQSQEANSLDQIGYEDLLKQIQKLPPAYQTTFCLFAIDGYTHEEIASQLGISLGTSKSNVFRARELLKKWLTPILNNKPKVIY